MAWRIIRGPERLDSLPTADQQRYGYTVGDDGQTREVIVEVSGSVAASDPAGLPSPIGEAARTNGRSAVEAQLGRLELPQRITVTTASLRITPRLGVYEPGDRVFVRDGEGWAEAEFIRPGRPDEAVTVEDPRIVGGQRRDDVAIVGRLDGDWPEARRYRDIRPEPPTT